MADLIGEESINWDTFEVTDPNAPEFTPQQQDVAEAPQVESLTPEETAQDGRPRDPETGRFVPAEETIPQEPQSDADPVVAEYLAKYGGNLDEAVKAAAHQSSLVGRQGAEIGELRQQMQDLVQALQQREQAAQPQFAQAIDIDSVIANEGFVAAAERTAAAGDWNTHNRVLAEWRGMEPDTANMYVLAKQAAFEAQQARSRAAELERNTQEARGQTAIQAATARLIAEFPDYETLQPLMREEAAEAQRLAGRPVYGPMLESGDPDQAFLALRTLASLARTRQAGSAQQNAAELARTAAAETQRAKAEAMVASATGNAPEAPAPKSYDQELLDLFRSEDAPAADGWQVGRY